MILADKIIDERKRCGWSQEELAAQLGVSRQAVSKWESAGSVPDLQRIIQMANLFGVTTDYLLKEELEPTSPVVYEESSYDSEQSVRVVSMEEANEFLEERRRTAPTIASGVSMCIISPALLVVLCTMAEAGIGILNENLATGIGLVFLFGLIAAAVYIFITTGMRMSRMDYMEHDQFETAYGVSGMVKDKKYAYEGIFSRGLAIGVVLCIVAVVPLSLFALADAPEYVLGAFTALMLFIIALGVHLIVHVSMVYSSFNTLLQEGDFTRKAKRANQKMEAVQGIYWSLVTAIYLGWSFWTQDWGTTWIVWPVAGVLSAVVGGIGKLIIGGHEAYS